MSWFDRFYIKRTSKLIGFDDFGNQYYESSIINYLGKAKRYVLYSHDENGSNVPPLWHSWLHYMTDNVPSPDDHLGRHSWQIDHIPNLTGTKNAYSPVAPAEELTTYSSWNPEKL
jgi:NADH:ubiquinone oxidoreductase subunit